MVYRNYLHKVGPYDPVRHGCIGIIWIAHSMTDRIIKSDHKDQLYDPLLMILSVRVV